MRVRRIECTDSSWLESYRTQRQLVQVDRGTAIGRWPGDVTAGCGLPPDWPTRVISSVTRLFLLPAQEPRVRHSLFVRTEQSNPPFCVFDVGKRRFDESV